MLISYPILPAGVDNQDEQTRLNHMLTLCQPDRGLYPVTAGNRWHGGVHLTPGTEPIRAIADGVIVAYRLAPASKDYPGQGSYDTSFVLIKHETDSGEHTRVVFYSLYMHLAPKGLLSDAQRQQLAPFLRDAAPSEAAVRAPANTRVWRKEVLGFGGQLYGVPTVHFEIFATEADFNAFWRDRNGIPPGRHGSDDVFGNSYFIIPAGQTFAERHPRAVAPHRIDLPGQDQFYELDTGQAGQNADRLLVIVKLDRGQRTATTFRLDAQGRIAAQVGADVSQPDYEYELYRLATTLYPDCPSAGFEYLRFGRILGPDTTTRRENWQLIRYADNAMGYINLADPAHQVSVLSDADFPVLWQKLEEGDAASPADGIANVPRLTELLQLLATPPTTSLFAPPAFVTRLRDANVAAHLRHFICKHPSEWDASDLDTRYAILRQPGKPLHSDDAWKDFKDHVEAMAFWPQAGLPERSVWHFHPLQFIQHYRRCGWLSLDERITCLPTGHGVLDFESMRDRFTTGTNTDRQIFPPNMHVSLNRIAAKYCIDSKLRLAHFFGQISVESDRLQTVREYASGNAYDMTVDPAKARELGNTQPGDGPRFKGRGVIQMTGKKLYSNYGEYRNRNYTDGQNNLHLQNDSYNACDASGYYWVAEHTRDRILNPPGSKRRYKWVLDGLVNINTRADHKTFQRLVQGAQVDADVLNVTLQINRAALHIDERRAFFKAAYFNLSDETTPPTGIRSLRP